MCLSTPGHLAGALGVCVSRQTFGTRAQCTWEADIKVGSLHLLTPRPLVGFWCLGGNPVAFGNVPMMYFLDENFRGVMELFSFLLLRFISFPLDVCISTQQPE